ncbi:MAG: hypothetical protein PHH57_09055, partial [Candidatus Omnitrophica bacterium]|nr:hypothetical protein [Candidatus Omnitrophota bacterium]
MAARFEYEVTSRDKSKPGVDSAKKNLGDLEKATQAFSGVMKAAVAGISFAAIGAGIKKVVDLYAEQEKVEIRLAAATRNNPYING